MSLWLAVTRNDIADYVSTLVLVYLVLIFVRIILSWIPRIPYNRFLNGFLGRARWAAMCHEHAGQPLRRRASLTGPAGVEERVDRGVARVGIRGGFVVA